MMCFWSQIRGGEEEEDEGKEGDFGEDLCYFVRKGEIERERERERKRKRGVFEEAVRCCVFGPKLEEEKRRRTRGRRICVFTNFEKEDF